ncbi:MAG: DinB family protein [Gemmatimonadaceae bacterium]|nr:DinB family protein [Gemmatimonadaceae bacterium]
MDSSALSPWAATVRSLLVRDLEALAREVRAYPDDATPWALPTGVPNSAGTLVQHCCGGLRHFVGAVLGETGYVRTRDREFSDRDAPREALLALIATTREEVDRTLAAVDDARLHAPYPIEVAHGSALTGPWLTHLVSHVAYHLGQVDYHRRLVTGDGTGVDAVNGRAVATWRALEEAK